MAPVPAVGQPFDPNQHEAIAYEPCDADNDGLVVAWVVTLGLDADQVAQTCTQLLRRVTPA